MPIQGLPRDAKFLAQVADLGLRLTHCRHRQPQLGGGHLERPAAFPPARAGRRLLILGCQEPYAHQALHPVRWCGRLLKTTAPPSGGLYALPVTTETPLVAPHSPANPYQFIGQRHSCFVVADTCRCLDGPAL